MTLMEGVLDAMWISKLKTTAVLLVVLGLGLGTAVTAYQGGLGERMKPGPVVMHPEASPALAAATAQAASRNEEPSAVDVLGDALPAKAVVRLGTERFARRDGQMRTSRTSPSASSPWADLSEVST
jgi:hypothetical protein